MSTATIDAGGTQREMLAARTGYRIFNLHREFRCWCEDQCAHRVARRRGELLAWRDRRCKLAARETGRLAGAGLRTAHHVLALHNRWEWPAPG